jgi:dienelactone hydrolase
MTTADVSVETFRAGPGRVPILSIRPPASGALPLVLFVHGFGSVKEDGRPLGERLAARGIGFAAIDCWLHGERGNDGSAVRWFRNVYPPETGLDEYMVMHEVIAQTAGDLEMLIACFVEDGIATEGKIGVCGFSMGAFATYLAAATNPQIAAAAAAGGVPAFRRAWEDLTLGASSYAQWSAEMDRLEPETEARARWLAGHDPFSRLASFAPRPLLMINGDHDNDQNWLYSLGLYRLLKPLYREALATADVSGTLAFDVPPIDHRFGPEEMDRVADWFARHLV